MKTLYAFESFYKDRGEFKTMELTLDRIRSAASECSIDDNIAKTVIHIAGTNGKGSTAAFIEQILKHRGLTTGCYSSPHIISIEERIRINGSDIKRETFDDLFNDLKAVIVKHDLSYFEGLTLIAFKYFKDNMPDAAIIETGLGGRFDSTNILERKIPVITSISKDHVEYLGDDVLQIADEKIAIVKNNLLVFVGSNTEYMNKYLDYKLHSKTIVRAKYSSSEYMGQSYPFSDNLRLAESVCDYIVSGTMPESFKLPPCRGEVFGRFILEGAHNEDALTKLAERFRGKKPTVIFSTTNDRDTMALLEIIKTFSDTIILTTIPDNERSINLNDISTNIIKEEAPGQALKIAVELSENADILVCGSFYLCAHVREILSKGML
ncbi:FolC bifunctional protein [Denitrovibrio acetiphilus DSM 12809]|uniref:FolC bifunctional protein n=1 Tax=Denitrovibrio acetiphilus (strain DSM 12809 / NBRC 114555 / N2460) TaxID=522772 RepID=D4H0W1_DENA2|nr:Mur ligase family protein [Denitrovibrio acetiphilus]ADD68624.1 FolC bifunctional protein [Denitrovibrio acetiphilus DSM 12809]